jgi:RHS repeat-associated protein
MKSFLLSGVFLGCMAAQAIAQSAGSVSFGTSAMTVHPTDGTINVPVVGTGGTLGAGASIYAHSTNSVRSPAPSTGKLFIDYTTNTTFVAGGLEGNGFASFGSLDNNTQYIPIPILISTNFPSRTIVLSFQSTPRAISGISDCTVTIINNYSVYSAVILSGTNYVSTAEIYRGQSPNSATIRIVRGDSLHTQTVYYSLSGNAASSTDYTASFSGSVTVNAGSSYVDIPVTAVTNTNIVGTKNLTLTLTTDADGSYQIGNSAATVSISQDVPVVSVKAISRYASPNNYYVGQFTLTRSGGLSNSCSVGLSVGGTATAGTDYIPLPSSVKFGTNQTSTNLYVWATNATLSAAKTVVLSLVTNKTYYPGLTTNDTVTLIPNSSTTNSVTSPKGMYWRGSGSDPTYWSQVVPLEYQTGTLYSNANGNCSALYPGLTSWSSLTFYHYNATNPASRILFNNPIVAFGERVGGTPLYYSQPYSFGIYGGDPIISNQPVIIQAYSRTNYQLAGTVSLYPPTLSNTNQWKTYATNGFQTITNAFGLTTILAGSPNLNWGESSAGAYVLTHTASDQATNYYFVVGVSGNPAGGSDPLVVDGGGQIAPALLYSLEFGQRPSWRSVFLDQPHFNGNPLPPIYAGQTLAEIMTNTPVVTNTVSFTPTAATNLDNSPELRRHPVLDNFVANMGNDPIALANYVINQIGLTDPMDVSDSGNVAETAINPPGVTRGALGTFLEKQGSPAEQCALLVYLLRQAGVPAVYEFAPRNGLQILDARLSQMLRFQVHGVINQAGQLYTTNLMIPVNYPWVAAYIGTNWVHIFPWMKDYRLDEGVNLFDMTPTNYSNAYLWVRDYLYGNTNLLSLAVNGDNTPRVIFPRFLQQTLLQNHPGVSVDDIGVNIINRQHYFSRWQDFPTPTWVTNISTPVENLSSSALTNINPALTNIFDTLSVEIYSQTDPTKNLKTGDMRLVDLHNRQFYINQSVVGANVQLSLILMPFRTNVTTQFAFSNDTNLLSKEVLTMTFDWNDDVLGVRFKYHRHRAINPAYAVDPNLTFFGLNGYNEIDIERPLRVGDQAAICLNYGQVTREMLAVHAADLWQMQSLLNAKPSQASSMSPDVYVGALIYLGGMTYYEKCSEFDQANRQWQKFSPLSTFAAGLSKIIPGRDSFGNLTNGTDPILPCVDMFTYQTAVVGNGTLHPDSGVNYTMAENNFNLLEITALSAEEHQTLNRYYRQTNAVSTVRLLQLAQATTNGIVPLNVYNYVAQGTTNYQGKTLQSWDANMWQQVVSSFQSAASYGYVSAFITPGPMTNSAYRGMGAMILSPYGYYALISPNSLNGAFSGQNLAANTVTAPNTTAYSVSDNNGDYSVGLTQPASQTAVVPDEIAGYDASSVSSQISSGTYVNTSFTTTFAGNVASQLGTTAGTSASAISQGVLTSEQNGYMGTPGDGVSQSGTQVSDPVNNVTGEFYLDETDLHLPGPIPLTVRRNYSSQNLADNQFGRGWKLSIMPYLSLSKNSTNIYAADMDGSVLAYVRQSLPVTVTGIAINNNGSAYAAGDVLTVAGGTGTAAQILVNSVNSGNITSATLISGGSYTVAPTTPNFVTGGSGTGAKFNLTMDAGLWTPTLSANPRLNNNTTAGVGGLANRLRDSIVRSVSGSLTNYTLYGADGSVRVFQFMKFINGAITNARPYLLQWTDSKGNYYTFNYDTNSASANFGQMTRIQCSNGNYLGFDYDVYGHVTAAYTGDGRWIYYGYDDFGDMVSVTLPDNSTRSYQYLHSTQSVTNGGVVSQLPYSTHLMIEEDKPDGRVLQNSYDSQRRVTNQLSTAGIDLTPIRTASFTYSNNFVFTNVWTNTITGYTLVVDGKGSTNRYEYTNSLITKITDPLGQSIQQIWFTNNAPTPGYSRSVATRIDKRGLVTQYQYDANGNVTNAVVTGDLTGDGITSQTATNTASYNTNNLPLQLTDSAGNSIVTMYDPTFLFLPQQVIRYAGSTPVSTNFMVYGNATNVVVNGNTTQTNLAFGVLTRSIRAYGSPDAATNDLAYDGHGFITQSTRYTGTSDPNVVNTLFYNERGDLVSSVDAAGAFTFAEHDALGRPIENDQFDESGTLLSWNFNYYNDNGELIWTDGPRYHPEDYVFYDYDGAGRRSTEIHWRSQAKADGTGVEAPAGYNLYSQSFFQYDVLGNLTLAVDPRGAMTTNTWDAVCRLVQRQHLDTDGVTVLSREGFGYEPGGQVQFYTNALGGVTTTLYTDTGKPEYRGNPDGSTNAWRYYLDGRIKREVQGNGAYWQTTYNDANRITTRIFYSASGTPLATNSVQTDRRGNVVQSVDEGNNLFTATYDDLDRVKVTAGPAIVTVSSIMDIFNNTTTYVTNVLQQVGTNFYDAAGRSITNINALAESTITKMDALGRATSTQIRNASGALVHEKYMVYSPDHNSVSVIEGSGANAITNTTYTDNAGRTVLSVAYPSSGLTEFILNQFDLAGNLVSAQHDSSTGGTVTTWTTANSAFDGLNRVIRKTDRDGALTTYAFDLLSNVTNRTMPGGLQWQATFNNAGQMLLEKNVGGGSATRTNVYAYFSSGSPFAGLVQTKTDGRGISYAYSYDDWLRTTNMTYSGSLPEQNLTTTWQYEPRGLVTSITEQFASTNTGPATTITCAYDPYGQLATESVNGSSFSYATSQSWDAVGRRTLLGISGGGSFGFSWRADGVLTSSSDPTGGGSYGYDTAGLLTNRLVGIRMTGITSRDGAGRPLSITTTVNGITQLAESMSWLGDGLLSSHTLVRGDFTDTRAYAYASQTRRLVQEQLNLNASAIWTNTLAYDNNASAGPGTLTLIGLTGGTSNTWSGSADAFSRVNVETNNTFQYAAYGHVNGQATLNAFLDNQPVSVTALGTNAMQWRSLMELSPGTHQLAVSALHPSGQFTAWATNTFTNAIAYQATADAFDSAGNITQRVWRNPNGTTNRTQTLSWDARGRLHSVSERDAGNSGYNWTAIYDGLNRRLSTVTVSISNGIAYNIAPTTINSYYDPQVEFLELGVAYGTKTVWKLYGPDLKGQYGGMNGTGGYEADSPKLSLFNPTISDFRGNILAYYDSAKGSVIWNPARPTGYGAVPGYRPVALANGADTSQSSAWRGRWADITGYYNIGLRPYDPVSGRWLSGDSVWNERDPNYYTFAGGDPINGFDADGRFSHLDYELQDLPQAFAALSDSYSVNAFYTYSSGARDVLGAFFPGQSYGDMNEQQRLFAISLLSGHEPSGGFLDAQGSASFYNQMSANGLAKGGVGGYTAAAIGQAGANLLDFFGTTSVQQSSQQSGYASGDPSRQGAAWGWGTLTVGSIAVNAIPGAGKAATLVEEQGVKMIAKPLAEDVSKAVVQTEFGFAKNLENPNFVLYKAKEFDSTMLREGEYKLNLPNLGSEALNWEQNLQQLQKAMSIGNPIREVNPQAVGGFLQRERDALSASGWQRIQQNGGTYWIKQ